MSLRPLLRIVHIVAGLAAFALVARFLAGTVRAELFGTAAETVAAKLWIAWRLPLLVLAMALAGASGLALAGRRPRGVAAVKMGRMRVIGANGLLVLVPSALFLAWQAAALRLDALFYAVQVVEIVAGGINLALLGLNIRDGLRMKRRFGFAGRETPG
ncbi:hypothetical protein [Phreatobacter sp. AB_2022a]|uniref:hypothetical protein n=1 Tax=Phreatobacter sp. AB_2022a TaxID=3003134 RepID=UPI0022875ACB|nr:hypothetical protein [Phreatobacter sp. AB_2022a]MCZ0733264.1 hypothetical protein [Phreatobacter sp. AB_2022a]